MWAIYFKLIKKSRIISIIAQNSWLAFKTRYLTPLPRHPEVL